MVARSAREFYHPLRVPTRSDMTPAELGAYQKAEVAKWAQVIKAAGIKAD